MSVGSRILCGVDCAEADRPAFECAMRLARASGAELWVVHAVPSERPSSWKAAERLRDLADLRHAAVVGGVSVKVSIQPGDPAKVLALHANARLADLIVLGTNRRTGWDRAYGGISRPRRIDNCGRAKPSSTSRPQSLQTCVRPSLCKFALCRTFRLMRF